MYLVQSEGAKVPLVSFKQFGQAARWLVNNSDWLTPGHEFGVYRTEVVKKKTVLHLETQFVVASE